MILPTYNLDEAVHGALRAGASGFLLKNAVPAELVRAVRAIAGGDAWLDPAVPRRPEQAMATSAKNNPPPRTTNTAFRPTTASRIQPRKLNPPLQDGDDLG